MKRFAGIDIGAERHVIALVDEGGAAQAHAVRLSKPLVTGSWPNCSARRMIVWWRWGATGAIYSPPS